MSFNYHDESINCDTERDNYQKKIILDPMSKPAFKNYEYPGFLFAFYRYSHSHKKSFVERFVSMAVSSDYIHVGIIPVHKGYIATQTYEQPHFLGSCPSGLHHPLDSRFRLACERNLELKKLELKDQVYTAFVGHGFEIQRVSAVLNDSYEYVFYPVCDYDCFLRGIMFLESLKGSGYNYFILPFTILPRRFKLVEEHSSSSTPLCTKYEKKCISPKSNPDIENFHSEFNAPSNHTVELFAKQSHHNKVICSEVGLSLLYHCDPFLHQKFNPTLCLPGELKNILNETPFAIPCEKHIFDIIGSS